MYPRLLDFLSCPACEGAMRLEPLVATPDGADGEVSEGLLRCKAAHVFPVVRGVPRLLPDSLSEHLPALRALPLDGASASAKQLMDELTVGRPRFDYDQRTRASFSCEWEYHNIGDKTWGMELDTRVNKYFVSSIGIPVDDMEGKLMLDAGCGNGSQSVAYTALGLEVIAIDLSSGLDHGQAFRHRYPNARPDKVHFIQADLQHPPLADRSVDIIHSAGVLHHTPSTERTFRALRPLLRPGGTFYVWLYKHERFVTPLVNGIRRATVRLPARAFDRLARAGALPFRAFCALTTRTGLRTYPELSRREAALALTDIFGVPYAHYHSFPEVREWFKSEGFDEPWPCNEDRRGFGICGRLPAGDANHAAADTAAAGRA